MRNRHCVPRYFLVMSICILVLGAPGAQARQSEGSKAASGRALSMAQWQDDLDQLTSSLKEIHPDLFRQIPEQDFSNDVNSLRTELAELSDYQIALRMAALVASVQDGHTRLSLPRQGASHAPLMGHSKDPEPKIDLAFHQLPVGFDLFDDGIYVTGASGMHQHLIGARLRSIGSQDAAVALEKMRSITYMDNEQTFNLLAPDRLGLAEALIELGVTDSDQEIPLQVVLPNGEDLSLSVSSKPRADSEWIPHQIPSSERPVWLQGPEEMSRWGYATPYRMQYLVDVNAVYVQINEMANDSKLPLSEFISDAVALAEKKSADRFILDLRKNHGGSDSWNRAIVLALLRSDQVNEFGRLYVLIGRRTFSAAVMLVGLLERWTEAIFVGEPTGSGLNHFGDPNKFQLENSGLTVRVSTISWHSWLAGENRPAYPPHVPVAYDGRDFFAGRDPVLEAAVSHHVAKTDAGRFRQLIEGNINHAAIWGLKYQTNPSKANADLEAAIDLTGRNLLAEGELELSRYSYLIGLGLLPDSESLKAGFERLPEPER